MGVSLISPTIASSSSCVRSSDTKRPTRYGTRRSPGYNRRQPARTQALRLQIESGDKVLGAVSGETSEDAIVLHFDIRYAVGQAHEQIIERIQAQAEAAGGRIVDILNDDPYYVQADDPRVQLLTATYNDVLGCEARPVAVGDGTHARFIPRALNFGPEFHADHVPAVDGIDLETPPFIAPGAGNAHGADEWASLKNLKTAFVLYALGLVRLDQYLQ